MNMMRAASSPMEPLNKNILLAGEVIAEKWKIGEKIGEGTFSQIYSAYSIESRDKVAVKVEAPSSLKPVLEWESLILKSLQDCPYVCRYYYHGKHGDSTVLVMELLGDSMSMLRMSPDSIHGVPLAKAVSVGLEMLDCIEAFHRHGYVHRDIKASNFALSAVPERNPLKQARYYIIDFGLSRQHLGEDRKVLPARQAAEFRGTSMYASLSSHRRQELGPKDDLWSWFYLVLDFLRGELPWAGDAQLKNRQTVLSLKEHFTETNPSLLVEGLPGATQLLEMMDYLQSLKYEDFPDYAKIRKQLQAVGESSLASENSDSGDEESSADRKETQAVADVSAIDWNAYESERERALKWADKAEEQRDSDGASDLLLTIAKRYKTFFDSDGLSYDEQLRVQNAVYHIERKSRARSTFLAPPPIQSFVKRRQSEQKLRSDALRKRRERDFQVRQSLETQNEQRMAQIVSIHGSSENVHGLVNGDGTPENGTKGARARTVKSESSMEVSDSDDVRTKRNGDNACSRVTASDSQYHGSISPAPQVSVPHHQPPHVAPAGPPGPPVQRWDHGGPIPPPPPPPGIPPSVQRTGAYGQPPPPPPPHLAGRYSTNGGIPPPPPGFPPNGNHHGVASQPSPPPPRNSNPEHRYASAPDRHYGTSVETREGHAFSYQRHQTPRENHVSAPDQYYPSESREDRGYGPQSSQKSPRDPVPPERHYDVRREDRYDGYHRLQKSPRESVSASDRHYDSRMETKDGRGYVYQRTQNPPKGNYVPASDRRYSTETEIREDRGYGYQQPPKSQKSPREIHGQYPIDEMRERHEKERYYEGKRPRSRSHSSRHGGGRSHHRSYSRSSSRSRSRSYSASQSPSPPSHSHRRSSRDYTNRHRESRKAESTRKYSRRQHSRSSNSSRSRSRSSSRSPSASPPTKRYRRRSSDLRYSKSSHRHSSQSASRRSSHSKDYLPEYSKGHSKEYPKEYYPKEYVKEYPKEYVKEYPEEHIKDYPKEYAMNYGKEYVKEYAKKHPPKSYSKEHAKDFHRRSPSPDHRHSHSRESQYRRSFSQERHRSHSKDYSREGESWGVDTRFKLTPTPEKHRRSSRWQPRA